MLTFEKILDVFAQYLMQDPVVEIVMTRRGYTVMLWDRKQENWWEAEYCATPEKMLEVLLESYGLYLEEIRCAGNRELTEEEKAEICADQQRIKALCEHK